MKFENHEDIYPLTIIKMRFGGKYVVFNAPEDSGHVQEVNVEEVSYRLNEWLDENVAPCLYGVGRTIKDALDDLISKQEE